MVAFIESGMYPVCQCKCVTQSILACGSFAGNDRPDFRSGSACLQASLSDTFPERFNILIWNTRYLYCKTGCQCNMAVPVFLRCFRYFGTLCRRYLSVSGDNPAVKAVGTFIMQETKRLDSGNVLRADCNLLALCLDKPLCRQKILQQPVGDFNRLVAPAVLLRIFFFQYGTFCASQLSLERLAKVCTLFFEPFRCMRPFLHQKHADNRHGAAQGSAGPATAHTSAESADQTE